MTGKKDKILAIESSCDDTSVAVVDADGRVWAWEQESQIQVHRDFGGVVPEVASRFHEKSLFRLSEKIFQQVPREQMVAVVGTSGPGLVGPLLVGRCFGEGLARGLGVEFRGIHHLRGHIASVLLDEAAAAGSLKERAGKIFPALVLLVSGGHSQILLSDERLNLQKLADTADDSAGECFDKVAKILGLNYPGGPEIEKRARLVSEPGDLGRAREMAQGLPRPRSEQGFSFSGLKTAARLRIEKEEGLRQSPEVFCHAFQEVIADTLRRNLIASLARIKNSPLPQSFVLCGGVSANERIREVLRSEMAERGMQAYFPPLRYCTDNAAMIAAAAWVQDRAWDLADVSARIPLG